MVNERFVPLHCEEASFGVYNAVPSPVWSSAVKQGKKEILWFAITAVQHDASPGNRMKQSNR
jgi:hypothetical protein